MMTWSFAARLVWNAPVVLGSDGPQAQHHPSLAAKPQVIISPSTAIQSAPVCKSVRIACDACPPFLLACPLAQCGPL
jgi:hypothetical protein